MSVNVEEKLKSQSGVENKTSGNLINNKMTVSNSGFYSSEEIGVIEVNWKGLYKDCKYAWISVGIFMILMLYGVWKLSSNGYFDSKKVSENEAVVKILEVTNYFGKKILVTGEITNNIPVEVRLPQKCVVDPRWIGSEVKLVAAKYQNNHTKIASFQFAGIEYLCDSNEGYVKAKLEKEKLKGFIKKISSYDIIPDIKMIADTKNETHAEEVKDLTKFVENSEENSFDKFENKHNSVVENYVEMKFQNPEQKETSNNESKVVKKVLKEAELERKNKNG